MSITEIYHLCWIVVVVLGVILTTAILPFFLAYFSDKWENIRLHNHFLNKE